MDAHIARTAIQSDEDAKKIDTKSSKAKPNEKTTNNKQPAAKPQSSQVMTKPEKEENVLDFVNEIKAQALVNSYQQAGFIYEPTSGLYYDTKSGYYYNPTYDLYYNGNDGNWYRLNPRTHEFIFHSGTETSQAVKKVSVST